LGRRSQMLENAEACPGLGRCGQVETRSEGSRGRDASSRAPLMARRIMMVGPRLLAQPQSPEVARLDPPCDPSRTALSLADRSCPGDPVASFVLWIFVSRVFFLWAFVFFGSFALRGGWRSFGVADWLRLSSFGGGDARLPPEGQSLSNQTRQGDACIQHSV
jgi:hypothetical protein